MTDIIPASVDVHAHPHPNSTVTMVDSSQATSYDASARPTPFLMAGFNPQAKLRKTQQQQQPSPQSPRAIIKQPDGEEDLVVTVNRPAPGKLAQQHLQPVSFVFTPPSVDIPASADAPDPVQTRPRARSSHEVSSPRAQQVAQEAAKPPKAVKPPPAAAPSAALPPLPPKRLPSPVHVDDKFLDFFTTAASIAATQPPSAASTATSTPTTTSRSVKQPDESEDEAEEEDDEQDDEEQSDDSEAERERRARKAERKAAKAAKKEKKEREKEKERKRKAKERVKKEEKKDLKSLAPVERERLSQAARWLANVDFYWVRHEADLSSSTGLGFTKHQVTWRFVLDHRLHELELFHSRFSGKRRIRLDSVELVNEKVLFDGGSSHEVLLGEGRDMRVLEVVIFLEQKPITFGYELLIEGLPFQRAKESWIMHTKQALAGYQEFAPTKKERHAAEEKLLKHEEMAATHHIKRKGSRTGSGTAL